MRPEREANRRDATEEREKETGTDRRQEMCPGEGHEGIIEGDAGPQAAGALVLRIPKVGEGGGAKARLGADAGGRGWPR